MYSAGSLLLFHSFVSVSNRLVAASTLLGLSQLVHLGDSLLEFDVLAFFVAMSLVLT